jgi:hypothetical protein
MKNRRAELRDGSLRVLAQKTNSSLEVIAKLYDEEVAHLEANSRVKKFIGVIASRRVKKRLVHVRG